MAAFTKLDLYYLSKTRRLVIAESFLVIIAGRTVLPGLAIYNSYSKSTRRLGEIVYLVLITCILCRLSSWFSFGNGYTNFYFQYMTRLDGLCIGSLIAIWRFSSYGQAKKKIIRLGLIVLSLQLILFLLSRTLLTNLPHFRFLGYTTIAAIFGIILFFAIEKRNVYSKFLLENSLIQYIGKISYGLYVYHWPVLILFKSIS